MKTSASKPFLVSKGPENATEVSIFVTDKVSLKTAQDVVKSGGLTNCETNSGGLIAALNFCQKNQSCKLLVVDISNVEMPLSGIKELMALCSLQTKIVIVGDIDRVSLYRDLIDLGVAEYLVKPIPFSLLKQCILDTVSNKKSKPAIKKAACNVVILGVAGGVGTTMIASSLADMLSRQMRRRTLMLDCQKRAPAIAITYGLKASNGLGVLCRNPDRADKLLISRNVEKIHDRLDFLSISGFDQSIANISLNDVWRLYPQFVDNYHFTIADIDLELVMRAGGFDDKIQKLILVSDTRISSLLNLQKLKEWLLSTNNVPEIFTVLNYIRPPSKNDISKDQIAKFMKQSIDLVVSFDATATTRASINGVPVSREKGPIQDALQHLANTLTNNPTRSRKFNYLRQFWERKRHE